MTSIDQKSQSSSKTVSPLMILVIVMATVIAGLGGYIIGNKTASPSEPAAASSQSGSADTPDGTPSAPPSDESAAAQTPEEAPEFAPSVEDEQTLEIIASQIQRDESDPRAVGKVDAPVVLVEYSDFSCPVCTQFATETEPRLKELVSNGTLRIEYRDFVIFSNYGSDIAAAGGWAAAYQGKYSEYRSALWEAAPAGEHPEYTEESVIAIAKKAGVPDLDRFRTDMNSEDTKAKIANESQAAQSIGLTGTPFFIINKAALGGAYPTEFVIKTIENQAELAQNQK